MCVYIINSCFEQQMENERGVWGYNFESHIILRTRERYYRIFHTLGFVYLRISWWASTNIYIYTIFCDAFKDLFTKNSKVISSEHFLMLNSYWINITFYKQKFFFKYILFPLFIFGTLNKITSPYSIGFILFLLL